MMTFYYAAKSAGDAERIVSEGFNVMDSITANMPYGEVQLVDQSGILVSTELDPSSGFAIEIHASPSERFLRSHELISPFAGVRYYILFISMAKTAHCA